MSLGVPEILESLLFVADRPLSVDELVDVVGGETTERDVRAGLEVLRERYREGERGVVLAEVGEGVRLRTAVESAPWLRSFLGARPSKLSRAALETLAIIAYRQPCTRADIERVRGVAGGGVLRALLDRRLIRIAGRRDLPGKPMVYATTAEFLDVLGLTSLGELPSLREFAELGPEDIEAVGLLLADAAEGLQQVTFEEYAHRRALARVDALASERITGRAPQDQDVG